MPKQQARLKEFPAGVLVRRFDQDRYSHDAGMQTETPIAVAAPSTERETAKIVTWCAANDVPVTGRGAGSSIAGNAFGSGVVVDFSRRMRRILHYDPASKTIRVEPGVVLRRLNRYLRRFGRRIGPSPSSEAFCTIGGMVGNNAAGSHSLLYGATAENVVGLRAVLADASTIHWRGPLRAARGRLQRGLARLAGSYVSPFRDAPKNSSGYLLDRIGHKGAWQFQRIFCGSEGTLGLVTEVTLATHPLPRCAATVLLGYASTRDALEAVPGLLLESPAAVELVDEDAIAVLKDKHPSLPASATASACALVIDVFADDPKELRRRVAHICSGGAESQAVAYAARDRAALWTARRDVEPLLRALPGRRRPLPFVEDVVVPVGHQPAYVTQLGKILGRFDLKAPLYGHAGQGNLHVRPFIDVNDPDERDVMHKVNLLVARLARQYGGSLTGEHGDGYLRTGLVRRLFPHAYARFQAVKRLFDPDEILNPGKVVESRRPTHAELYLDGPSYTPAPWL